MAGHPPDPLADWAHAVRTYGFTNVTGAQVRPLFAGDPDIAFRAWCATNAIRVSYLVERDTYYLYRVPAVPPA